MEHGGQHLGQRAWQPDAIELAPSHSPDAKDAVRSAYNQAEYPGERRTIQQDFADWRDRVAVPAQSVMPSATGPGPVPSGVGR